jgi:hypothetical protein
VLKNVLHQQSKDPVRKDSIEEAEDILSEPEEEDDEQSLPSLVSYRISSVTSTGTVSRSSSFSSSCSSMLIYVKDALDQLELDSGDEEEEWEDEARHVRQSLPPPPAVESSHSAFKDNGDQDSTPKMINLIHRKQKKHSRSSSVGSFQESFMQDSFVMENLSERQKNGRNTNSSLSNSQECTLQDSFLIESVHTSKTSNPSSSSSQGCALQDSFATTEEDPQTPQKPRSILKTSRSMPQPPQPSLGTRENSRSRMLKACQYQSTTDRSRSYSSGSYSNSSFSNSSDRSRWDPE